MLTSCRQPNRFAALARRQWIAAQQDGLATVENFNAFRRQREAAMFRARRPQGACGEKLALAGEATGEAVPMRCSKCGAQVTIPAADYAKLVQP